MLTRDSVDCQQFRVALSPARRMTGLFSCSEEDGMARGARQQLLRRSSVSRGSPPIHGRRLEMGTCFARAGQVDHGVARTNGASRANAQPAGVSHAYTVSDKKSSLP